MTRLLTVLALIAALLVIPAALAQGQHDCDVDDPFFAPEGGIFLSDKRGPDFEYTVTLEGGLATATVGNDNCSPSDGTVTVAGVTIDAPTEQGAQNTADLGVLPAGTQTFDVTVSGMVSVWLLIESTGFEEEIACGESTTMDGDGVATAEVAFQRGDDNASKNENPCSVDIGVNLESTADLTEQTVTFEFEVTESPSWFGTFTWAPEPAAMPVPATEIDLDLDGTADGTLSWCSGFSGTDASTGNPLPILPAGESWCVVSQNATLLGGGDMQVEQVIYGLEDPGFARPK